MEDFKISLQAEIDKANSKSQIESDINSLSKSNKLKIQVDTDNITKSIQKAIQDAFKGIKIPPLGGGKPSDSTSQYKKEYQQLSKLAKQMGSIRVKITGLDATKNKAEIDTLIKQLDVLRNNYSLLSQSVGRNLSTAQLDNLQAVIDGTNNKIDVLNAKLTDTKAKIAQGIQYKIDVGDYATDISRAQAQFEKWGFSIKDVDKKMKSLKTAYESMSNANTEDKRIKAEQAYQEALQKTKNEITQMSLKTASPFDRVNLSNKIQVWLDKNSNASKEAQAQLRAYLSELENADLAAISLKNIEQGFKNIQTQQRALGNLGKSWSDAIKTGMKKFTEWGIAAGGVTLVTSKIKESISELKEVNTLLTEISKANDKLSKTDLQSIGNGAFEVASKYGKKATDYLSGIQEASRAGYENAEEIAELSTAAQGAGDMTAELANQMIIATDKAYKMNGSVSELTKVLDGINYITNHNAVNMTELSESMSIVGSTAASFGVDVNETAAAVGTMAATTQQSGSEVARAFRAILLNIRQVSDEEEGIDAEGLTKYENACNELNVKLKETKNGVLSLRDPMEVLHDLSIEYNKLEESDIRRTNLLSAVGGKLRATQLDALLRQWDTYESMLQQYADGSGSMAVEAEKTANSWEGSMNRLSNTWTDTIENIANSDAIITAIMD